MEVSDRKKLLLTLGTVIAKQLEGFWGNVRFDIKNGVCVGGEICEGFKEEKDYKR